MITSPDEAARERVRLHLSRVDSTRTRDLLSPIFENHGGRAEALRAFQKYVQPALDEWRGTPYFEWERLKFNSCGSYSRRVTGWWKPILRLFDKRSSSRFRDSTLEWFRDRFGHLRTNISFTIPWFPKNTNTGLPWFRTTTSDVLDEVISVAKRFLVDQDFAESFIAENPYVLGIRTQPEEFPDKSKNRVVWMESKPFSVVGNMVSHPVVANLRRTREFAALQGHSAVVESTEFIRAFASVHGSEVISLDHSKFDTNISHYMIGQAMELINWLTKGQGGVITNLLYLRATQGKLETPDGLFIKKRGIPSGHPFTNLIDSIVSLLLVKEISDSLGARFAATVMGDDCVVSFSRDITLEELADAYSSFGFSVNPEKQLVDKEYILYLNKMFSSKLQGARSVFNALNSMGSYERLRQFTKEQYTLRLWSQLQEAEYCPVRMDLLHTVMNLDKYHLGLDIPGGFESVLGLRHDRRMEIFTSDRNVPMKLANKPIFQWWFFKYLTTKEVV